MDCYAKVVYGFKLDVEPFYVKKTKYDENQGTPYQVGVLSHYVGKIEGKVVFDDFNKEEDFYDGEVFEGLKITEVGFVKGGKVIGVTMAESNEWDGWLNEIPFTYPEEVINFAHKYGLEPKLFLIQICG